ncbi:hypothetical protein [Lysinibacillus fusiformis]|uniref:Uncharacterized protein n=1 Tax=Lysinibacillus fusiformis TaxID=28031 RepID=A0A2I0UZX5_9BACI|nr:hypothetical protein [Lysinibacillus fusiformis]PKU51613.1 hypothetical protein CRI88_13020 [Lysinibacillus fusiformis]
MNDKKSGKLQVLVIVFMILLLVAAFVLFFLGHYMIGFILFGIFMLVLNAISNWTKIKNEEYVYLKNHKNNEYW